MQRRGLAAAPFLPEAALQRRLLLHQLRWAPKLLAELEGMQGTLPRKLDPAKKSADAKVSLDRAAFDAMHAADQMATDKLKEGIDGFSKAIDELEKLLEAKLN